MPQNDTTVPLANAHHDAEVKARALHATLAEARWEARREHAAEAVHRLKARRQLRGRGGAAPHG